jgi:predicted transcriptional regulator of viral defense system
MIGSKKWAPRKPPVGLRIIRATGAALHEGVDHPEIEGVSVPIYSVAKTIADCFKHRNKMGMDVAIKALRGCLRERKCTADDLWRYAKVCRVQNVMRPYLQALL